MTRVERLEQEIAELSPEEFVELREWLLERDWRARDEQIERDAEAGKLDRLADEAIADHSSGRTTPL